MTIIRMVRRSQIFGWSMVPLVALVFLFLVRDGLEMPELSGILFWIGLLVVAELLPVTLGFGTVVTMSFPVALAIEILYEPAIAMVIVGIGSVDLREFRGEIPAWRALFNRGQVVLAAAAASSIVHAVDDPLAGGLSILVIAMAAFADLGVNLGLVAAMIRLDVGVPVRAALRGLIPRPAAGFFLSQAVLAALGVAAAAAFLEIGGFVSIFVLPLIFARLSYAGARKAQDLSEELKRQQEALLEATRRVFEERERERKRIAEDIHDGSLQLFAAAAYSAGNARELLANDRSEESDRALVSTRATLEEGIEALRGSLLDLRTSAVLEAGLETTIRRFAADISLIWNADITIDGEIRRDPPVAVALAAFQILQEAVINALKHSETRRVRMTFDENDTDLQILIQDDGVGFDMDTGTPSGHIGMGMMNERAASIGGTLAISSAPGRGTTVRVTLPIEPA